MEDNSPSGIDRILHEAMESPETALKSHELTHQERLRLVATVRDPWQKLLKYAAAFAHCDLQTAQSDR